MTRRRVAVASISLRLAHLPPIDGTRLANELGQALAQVARDVAPRDQIAVRIAAPASATPAETARAIATAITKATKGGR